MTVVGQRFPVQVEYLTSGLWNQHVLHFFQAQEQQSSASPQAKRRKRLLVLVDRPTYLAELDNAVDRCVAVSRVTVFSIFDNEMSELTRSSTTQYDILLEMLPPIHFVRVITAVFKPHDPYNPIPTYELEEKQPIQEHVFVRETSLYIEDRGELEYNTSNVRLEEVTRRMLDDKDKEIEELRTGIAKQKDQYMLEAIDLQNRVEELKHSLDQAEYLLRVAKQNQAASATPPTVLQTNRKLRQELDGQFADAHGGIGGGGDAWVPHGSPHSPHPVPVTPPSSHPPPHRVSSAVNVAPSPVGYHASVAQSPSPSHASGTTTINVFKRSGNARGAYTSITDRR